VSLLLKGRQCHFFLIFLQYSGIVMRGNDLPHIFPYANFLLFVPDAFQLSPAMLALFE
jgi:hypothetical protein